MPRPAWQPDESVSTGVDYSDPAVAAAYDQRHARFRDFEREAQAIHDALRPGPESVVVELGAAAGRPLERGVRPHAEPLNRTRGDASRW